jgi:hypothetical protein
MNQEFRIIAGWQKLKVTRVVIGAVAASLFLVTVFSHAASAQAGAPGASVYSERRASQPPVPRTSQAKKTVIDRRLESLTKELNLSQVQRAQTMKILEEGQEESLHLWNDQQLAPIDRMVRLRSIREDAQKKFRALLTRDQQTKYDEIVSREVQAYSLPRSKGGVTASKSN